MKRRKNALEFLKKAIWIEAALAAVLFVLYGVNLGRGNVQSVFSVQKGNEGHFGLELETADTEDGKKDYIKWVDFQVSYDALCKAYEWDVNTHGTDHEICWIELLAYTAAKSGGTFDDKALEIMEKTAKKLEKGEETIENLTKDMKYYSYYREAYDAVLGGLVGEYKREIEGGKLKQEEYESDEQKKEEKENVEEGTKDVQGADDIRTGTIEKGYEIVYGLKAYSPIARGFSYEHYDDFGAGRSYGFKRKHLGHDMMGLVGTPITAIESGYVEALGWNQYGGWRIGIRSFDKKRYYYYAHLRQNYPYAEGLKEGSVVTAGDVIGYMGHTGYSTKENVNNIEVTHLHWGLQLIFDESQKECNSEIWIDVYPLTQFLAKHTQPVKKVEGTKEWVRSTTIIDPVTEEQ